jgi:hypothetical protein
MREDVMYYVTLRPTLTHKCVFPRYVQFIFCVCAVTLCCCCCFFSSFTFSLAADASSVSSAPTASSTTLLAASDPPAPLTIDDTLLLSLYEALAEYQEVAAPGGIISGGGGDGNVRGNLPLAIETAVKGGNNPRASEYNRRKLCEMAHRMQCQMVAAAAAAAAANAAAGGKGAAAKPAAPAKGAAAPVDASAFRLDNPLLIAFAALAQAELPVNVVSREVSLAHTDKAVTIMNTEAETFLSKLDWVDISVDRLSQVIEMQAEIYTRITRMKILFGDIIGAQDAAEKCLGLISPKVFSCLHCVVKLKNPATDFVFFPFMV